jgi:hypothetical protein
MFTHVNFTIGFESDQDPKHRVSKLFVDVVCQGRNYGGGISSGILSPWHGMSLSYG